MNRPPLRHLPWFGRDYEKAPDDYRVFEEARITYSHENRIWSEQVYVVGITVLTATVPFMVLSYSPSHKDGIPDRKNMRPLRQITKYEMVHRF